jgi:hypothetical protein
MAAKQMRQAFEYHTIISDNILSSEELNKYGEQGWEMCGMSKITERYAYCFKRPRLTPHGYGRLLQTEAPVDESRCRSCKFQLYDHEHRTFCYRAHWVEEKKNSCDGVSECDLHEPDGK